MRPNAIPSLLLLAIVLVVWPQKAGAYEQLVRIPVSAPVRSLQTDGRFVVWEASQPANPDQPATLMAAALADGKPIELSTNLPSLSSTEFIGNIAINGSVVVWLEGTGAERVIRSRNLITGQTQVVATGDVRAPGIEGSTVTWWEHVGPQYAQRPAGEQEPAILKARNIATMAPAVVLAQTPNYIYTGFGPSKMGGGWVVWGQATTGGIPFGWELRAVPITGGTPRVVGDPGFSTGPDFDIVGDRLVYVRTNNGGRPQFNFATVQNWMIMTDLRTGQVIETGPHGALNDITTDGQYVFWDKWQDEYKGIDLWGYAPTTESAFKVVGGGTPFGTSTTAQPALPSARNGVVAWLWHTASVGIAIHAAPTWSVLPTARTHGPWSGPYFPESGHTLRGSFHQFWERSGGLPVFGYPLTEEFIERNRDTGQGHPVQYLERQRFEFHPENAGTPYEVLLGRLGSEALQRAGRPWESLPKANPNSPHYFAATGHAIAPQFYEYWRTHGLEFGDAGVTEREALALFGYPITEPVWERNSSGDTVLTQWFERARFEHHPNNPQAHQVLLGRLSAEILAERGW